MAICDELDSLGIWRVLFIIYTSKCAYIYALLYFGGTRTYCNCRRTGHVDELDHACAHSRSTGYDKGSLVFLYLGNRINQLMGGYPCLRNPCCLIKREILWNIHDMVLMDFRVICIGSSGEQCHHTSVGDLICLRIDKVPSCLETNDISHTFRRWILPMGLQQISSIGGRCLNLHQYFYFGVISWHITCFHLDTFWAFSVFVRNITHCLGYIVPDFGRKSSCL